MTGKVPEVSSEISGLKIAGSLRVFWSNKHQRFIARGWPTKAPPMTPARRASIQRFKDVVQLIKTNAPEDVMAAEEFTANSPFLVRDVLMMAATGKLVSAYMADGTYWTGLNMAFPEIQTYLDSISNVRGTILFRGAQNWIALEPGDAGDVLTTHGAGADPDWAPSSGGGGSEVNYFGMTNAPSLASYGSNGAVYIPVLVQANQTMKGVGFMPRDTKSAAQWRVALYADSASAVAGPGALLAQDAGVNIGFTAGALAKADFVSPFNPAEDTLTWLAFWCNTTFNIASGNEAVGCYHSGSTSAWADPAPAPTHGGVGAAIFGYRL
jgi:hypothetical protein